MPKSPQASPVPKDSTPNPIGEAVVLLDFFDALREVVDGKKVTRVDWNNPNIYVWLDTDRLRFMDDTGKKHDLLVSIGDMVNTDWFVV